MISLASLSQKICIISAWISHFNPATQWRLDVCQNFLPKFLSGTKSSKFPQHLSSLNTSLTTFHIFGHFKPCTCWPCKSQITSQSQITFGVVLIIFLGITFSRLCFSLSASATRSWLHSSRFRCPEIAKFSTVTCYNSSHYAAFWRHSWISNWKYRSEVLTRLSTCVLAEFSVLTL